MIFVVIFSRHPLSNVTVPRQLYRIFSSIWIFYCGISVLLEMTVILVICQVIVFHGCIMVFTVAVSQFCLQRQLLLCCLIPLLPAQSSMFLDLFRMSRQLFFFFVCFNSRLLSRICTCVSRLYPTQGEAVQLHAGHRRCVQGGDSDNYLQEPSHCDLPARYSKSHYVS